ncbi:MAG: hypothetical protein AAF799_14125 [Myxococcota bacterium]
MTAKATHPYVDFHPGPGDATAHFALEAMCRAANSPEAADGDRVSTTVTHIESPSVQTAWRLRMAEIGITLPLVPFFEAIQSPDPRVPKGQVEFVAWAYQGTTAAPQLGSPDAGLAEAVTAIARQLYDVQAWSELAAHTAARFGTPWAQHLVAVMLDPPKAPDHLHPLEWVPRVQVAAALVLAHGEQGYSVLRSLALGPVDWTIDAAIIALGDLAVRNPALRGEVEQLFGFLRDQIPKEGFTCYGYPLACTWRRLVPEGDPRHAELLAWQERIESGDEPGTTSSGAIGVIDGINMEDYARFNVEQDLLIAKGDHTGIAALAQAHGVPVQHGGIGYVPGWQESIDHDARLALAFEQTKARIRLSMQGIDPDSEEARLSHNVMQGKGLDQEEEMRKAQAAQQQLAAGGDTDPDPTVFPGQAVAKLSDYVQLMKRMQSGDFNGALSAYGLDMGTYGQIMQAWSTKLGVDPTLNAKFGAMMA